MADSGHTSLLPLHSADDSVAVAAILPPLETP